MAKIPPPPQAVPVIDLNKNDGRERVGLLSKPWNLWLQRFIDVLQSTSDSGDSTSVFIWAAMMRGK